MEENISPEQRQTILEQRRMRMQGMGIPMPQTPIVPSNVTNVKDPNMLKRIQEIKNGNLKKEFREFEHKATGGNPNIASFEELPVPKNKNQQRTQQGQPQGKIHVPLEEFTSAKDPQLDELDKIFNFESKPKSISEMMLPNVEDGGKSFVANTKAELQRRLQKKQLEEQQSEQYSYSQQNVMPLQSGMIILNEEDLKKKIIEITKPLARQIATEVIKNVLEEYAKKTSGNKQVVTEKVNKAEAEILPNGRIKIGGKIFKVSEDKK